MTFLHYEGSEKLVFSQKLKIKVLLIKHIHIINQCRQVGEF